MSVPLDNAFLDDAVAAICATYEDGGGCNHIEGFNLPGESEVERILEALTDIIFPGYAGRKAFSMERVKYNVGETLSVVHSELSDQVARALRYDCAMDRCEDCDIPDMARVAVEALISALPEVRNTMKSDVAAAFDGDPAAKSLDEIILSYPGLKAITAQRLAHVLHVNRVPLLPRMMCESAHRRTGIDIHPGAVLGREFFIDHGTGVVIGETCVIGDNVKIYQGVTLGALSFPKDERGRVIKGAKRHPTIEDNVTIYSGATILGDIVVGRGAVIGGNVWLTENVAPGAKITIRPPELSIRGGFRK
jgi:serine O-acetyltransferase